jgi:2-oxoacid dehydrogenase-like protein with E3 subunit-binding domain
MMAEKATTSKRSSTSSRNGKKPASSRTRTGSGRDGARPAQEALLAQNDADREYRRYVHREEEDRVGPPDVLLDVPELRIHSIHFELDDLDAHVALKAQVLNLVKLNVGVDVHLSKTTLDVKGVEAQLVLKARLDHVTAIVDRLMTSLDRNPELVKGLSRAVSDIGQGAGQAVDKTGDAAKDVGKGAQSALKDVGQGAGEATGDIGEGAGQAVGDVGQGAGQAVGDVGQGAGQAVGDVGQGAGQAVGDVGQLVGGVGQSIGQTGQGAGQAGGAVAQTLGSAGEAQPQGDARTNGGAPARPGALAKEAAKLAARELRHAASDEARDLGLAATRKMRELGERREQRRADKYHATENALQLADDLGIDIAGVEGTGGEGRVTVRDVRKAQEA